MQLVADDIEGNYYIDIILSPNELKRIEKNEMVSGELILKRRKYYLGVRLRGNWDNEEEEQDAE